MGVVGELGEGGEGGFGVFVCEVVGVVEVVEFYEGGFVGFGVFVSGFFECGVIGGCIENVIYDLEGEVEFVVEGVECVEFRIGLKLVVEFVYDE